MRPSKGAGGRPALLAKPRPLGGIRNAARLAPYNLWRGEQPPASDDTAEALRRTGVQSIVSLRPDGEEAGTVGGRACRVYCLEDERLLWEGHGFGFRHVPLIDFVAPHPSDLATALRLLDEEIDAGRGVFIHCRAGVGRTGMTTSAWLISRGVAGDDAAEVFLYFSRDAHRRTAEAQEQLGEPPSTREEYFARVRLADQWWAITQMAEALGSPISRAFDVPVLSRPEGTEGWEELYQGYLRPWARE